MTTRTNPRPRRHLRDPEKRVLRSLLLLAEPGPRPSPSIDQLEVEEMADGGMGSLYFVHPSKGPDGCRFGGRIAELEFKVDDGVPVLVSLNVDADGDLYELDVWKVDFNPLLSFKGAERTE